MNIFKKLTSFAVVTIIIFLIMLTIQINTFAIPLLNRNTINVGVMLYSFDDPYMLLFKQSLENIQKEKGNELNFTFFDGKNNIAIQNETLDSLLKTNVDLLIVHLANIKKSTVEDVILQVKQKNIPLILLGVYPQIISTISKDYDKVAFITPNLGKPGTIEGKILVDLWNSNKEVIDKNGNNIMQYIMLKGQANSSVADERTKYSLAAINNTGIKTEELASISAYWSKELAKQSIDSLFFRYGNKLEVIISNNDAMAIGAIEALQKYGYNIGDKSKYISVVGIDGIPEAKDLIDKGLMTGTVIIPLQSSTEGLYNIAMNLINNLPPTENTNYEVSDGAIILPISYQEYTKK
jgi:methyl-galactoside transport system substrate-binding protein